MKYAYHICNGIGPTVISISQLNLGHVIYLTKILGRGWGGGGGGGTLA